MKLKKKAARTGHQTEQKQISASSLAQKHSQPIPHVVVFASGGGTRFFHVTAPSCAGAVAAVYCHRSRQSAIASIRYEKDGTWYTYTDEQTLAAIAFVESQGHA